MSERFFGYDLTGIASNKHVWLRLKTKKVKVLEKSYLNNNFFRITQTYS